MSTKTEGPKIEKDGTAWVLDLGDRYGHRQIGTVIWWPDKRSATGMLSGIVIEIGPCCAKVNDIRAATVEQPLG